jgi:hypothetical protein
VIPTDASVEDIRPTAPETLFQSVQRPIDVMSLYAMAQAPRPVLALAREGWYVALDSSITAWPAHAARSMSKGRERHCANHNAPHHVSVGRRGRCDSDRQRAECFGGTE